MRIMHLEASSGWGGQEIRILREAEGMRSRGHEVILGVMKKGSLIEKARDSGFTVYPLSFRKKHWPLCFLQLLRIFDRHQIQLVNTHSSLDAWIGGFAARCKKIPLLRTRHLSTPIKPGFNSRLIYGKLADFVVTTCSSILPVIAGQSGKSISSCRSIPTGVDCAKIQFDPKETLQWREKFGIRPTDFVIGTACFMRSWKGIDDLLEAAHRLREFPDIRWLIIGGGHSERHHRKAQELHLDGIVHFTGHLERPFPAIAALDVFALLSTAHEGVSQAILQAAFLRIPLIATPVGGLSEVCIDRQTGLSVPPFRSDLVARAVRTLKENPSFRSELAQNAHLLVSEKFTLESTLDQMEEVMKFLVCEKKVNAL